MNALPQETLSQIFQEARSHNVLVGDIPDETLHKLYDLTKFGPTAANQGPARFVFVKSKEAKERLKPFLAEGNIEKTLRAPVTVIIGYDLDFYEHLPFLFPHTDAKSWFEGKEKLTKESAFRNGTLQGAYMILAARALGLDTGPMSGFDAKGVDKEFFSGTNIKSNFLVNLGFGDNNALFPRHPRLDFNQASQIL